jgi:hypothetical protein
MIGKGGSRGEELVAEDKVDLTHVERLVRARFDELLTDRVGADDGEPRSVFEELERTRIEPGGKRRGGNGQLLPTYEEPSSTERREEG